MTPPPPPLSWGLNILILFVSPLIFLLLLLPSAGGAGGWGVYELAVRLLKGWTPIGTLTAASRHTHINTHRAWGVLRAAGRPVDCYCSSLFNTGSAPLPPPPLPSALTFLAPSPSFIFLPDFHLFVLMFH